MKLLLSFIAVSVVLLSCNNASTEKETGKAATVQGAAAITFEKNNFDFGKVKQGAKVTHEFNFINNGTDPLVITNATASCGCTIPDYPKEPVLPGKSGKIKVVFDTAGKTGMQNKIVSITSNATPPLSEVYLTGEVLAK